ncbi:hypothetical protein [Bradyrhizobium sp. th.b2]|uniref:hypothetical protein n=1 Tax=Bradyrhizobium sp. th-b2 TaxID=172088 RepID=UPI00048BE605|nr:hypothetical protein [Bradyrhizobium sp. th.b2]
MKMKSSAVAPAIPAARPINPKFKDRLPGIMTEICDSLLIIEPAIERVTVQLKEFLDYLGFEIQKTDLEIKQARWEAKVDLAAVRELEAWLQQLQQLKADFDVNAMTSPPERIRAMLDRVQKLFGL